MRVLCLSAQNMWGIPPTCLVKESDPSTRRSATYNRGTRMRVPLQRKVDRGKIVIVFNKRIKYKM